MTASHPNAPADAPARVSRAWAVARVAAMYALAFRGVRALSARSERSDSSIETRTVRFASACVPAWPRDARVDVRVWTSVERDGDGFHGYDGAPVLERLGARVEEARMEARTVSISAEDARTAARGDGTLRLRAVVSRFGRAYDPADVRYDARDVVTATMDLVTMRETRETRRRRLLDGGGRGEAEAEDETETTRLRAFFKPNATLTFVNDYNAYRPETIPDILANRMRFTDERRSGYYPVVYFNEFWLLKSYLRRLNETIDEPLELKLDVDVQSMMKWQFQTSMEQTWETQRSFGVSGENDADDVKRVFLEGNPVLLAITTVVSMLHSVFDFLAFRNDVAFWKNRKSMEGLSSRSVVVNAVCQLVVFLYLCDNETSWMILISSGVGTAIEFWKVTRAMDVSFSRRGISFKEKESSVKSETAKHDADAVRYLSYVLYPCIFTYAVHSLRSHEHKSWWSFVLNTAVSCVYMFGFITMCPQLYINYKLKSVAAMPWKQMTYKFLNTIIDDLFAFVVKMPTLHRLSVFRDDVVFLAFLYQRRLYRVDPTRVNEFGFAGESPETNDDEPDESTEDDLTTPAESKKDR